MQDPTRRAATWCIGLVWLLSTSAAVLVAGDTWQEDLPQSVRQSRTENRPLVILLTKEQCPHCVRLKTQTLLDGRLQQVLAARFVSVKLDGPRHQELLRKAGVRVYPTILVVSPQNQLLTKIDGYVDAPTLLGRLGDAQRQSLARTASETPR